VEPRGPAAYIAEFIGTFVLVMAISMTLTLSGGVYHYGLPDLSVLFLVHAFALLLLISSLGSVSGAHFNPAVTTALTAIRKIAPVDAVIYVLCQLSGAVLGTLVVRVLLVDEGRAAKYGATTISQQLVQGKVLPGLVAETIGTFLLMWAIMAMAVNPRSDRDWAGLVIGGTLGLAVMLFGPLTGAGFNPARSFGPALVSGTWTDFWVYVLAPVVGALLAAFAYTGLVLKPQERVGERPVDKLP
jgi:glycerol uptake facilitator protein